MRAIGCDEGEDEIIDTHTTSCYLSAGHIETRRKFSQ
jgi:hypothetical protein